MNDICSNISALRRPKILLRAARTLSANLPAQKYSGKIVPLEAARTRQNNIQQMLEFEERLDQMRREGNAEYSAQQHVTALARLINQLQRHELQRCAA